MNRYAIARSPRFVAFAAAAAGVVFCLSIRSEAKPLNVVTTTSDLADIAKAVAGDRALVKSICTGKRDPHFLQAKPSYIMMARRADLWIRSGMELEIGWEAPILDGARNPRIRVGAPGHLDASEKVVRLGTPSTRITRAMGDVHPSGNPHYWLDPLNGRLAAKSIAERLTRLAPEHASEFAANLAGFEAELDRRMFGEDLVKVIDGGKLWALLLNGALLDHLKSGGLEQKLGGWLGAMAPLRGRKIITYHRSWTYFVRRFGIEATFELEPKPGVPPSASHLAKVMARIRNEELEVILMEPFYRRKAADVLAAKTGVVVLVCPNSVGGAPEAEDYLSLIDLIVNRLKAVL